MSRKRIPFVTSRDHAYSATLPLQSGVGETESRIPVGAATDRSGTFDLDVNAPRSKTEHGSEEVVAIEPLSTKIDVRVTALSRQEPRLNTCGVAPVQVLRAALRAAVKRWVLSPIYVEPSSRKRAIHAGWTVRTSLAVPTATFDRLLAAQDPLGVCSRWSLVRGQLEPAVWDEIDRLLVTLVEDADT